MPVGSEAVLSAGVSSSNVSGNSSESAVGFVTREDAKKKRELEEARKSGLIPAEKDEDGKDINPHIPQYIAKAPWYLTKDSRPSLKHQRFSTDTVQNNVNQWYTRGIVTEAVPLRFRKGACANCGAMTHSFKECTERPRKKGAKWTGKDMRADELIVEDSVDLNLDFDGKRDRYGGYDAATYRLVVRDYELADRERKKRKAEQLQADLQATTTDGDEAVLEDEGVRVHDFDQANAPIGVKDDHTRTTSMNLRIREDTAKYLFNLDPESAFYDPKSRSMRDNPLKHLPQSEQGIYLGDNLVRSSGDAQQLIRMEAFAWDAYTHNLPVHTQAQPTQLELLYKNHLDTKFKLVEAKKRGLLEKYGATEQEPLPAELVNAHSEAYAEFAPGDGRVVVLKNVVTAQSKYQEDVFLGEHTSVWGSWYNKVEQCWGFACCQKTEKADLECESKMI